MDVSSRIRAQLLEGKWPDEIVAGLVAEGMTEANARRIVDRITAEGVAPPTSPAAATADGTKGRRFPIELTVMLLAIVAIGVAFIWEAYRPPTAEEKAAAERVEQRKVEDQKRTAELSKGGSLEEQAKAIIGMMAGAEKAAEVASDTRAAHELLQNPDGFMRCEGARLYEQGKIPDKNGDLARLLENDPDVSVRRCVLNAMLASGTESNSILNVLSRIDKTPTLREIAIHGYTQLLQDPVEDVRTRATAALQRLNR